WRGARPALSRMLTLASSGASMMRQSVTGPSARMGSLGSSVATKRSDGGARPRSPNISRGAFANVAPKWSPWLVVLCACASHTSPTGVGGRSALAHQASSFSRPQRRGRKRGRSRIGSAENPIGVAPLPPFNSTHGAPRDATPRGALSAHRSMRDRDALSSALLAGDLGQSDGQDAVAKTRLRALVVDLGRKREPSFEAAVVAFAVTALFVVVLMALLASEDKHIVFHSQLDVLFFEPRQFGRDAHFLVALNDIHLRPTDVLVEAGEAETAEGVVEQPVHLAP